jgi:Tol biopolymer transport system component
LAYTGADGNVWLHAPTTGEERQITTDAIPWDTSGSGQQEQVITYCCADWSPDGQLLAFRREEGNAVQDGFEFSYSLWVFEQQTGEARPLLEDQQVTGFSWRPGTHQISFALPVAMENFTAEPPHPLDASYLTGIHAIDADTGETSELVRPERGYTLVNPRWSPDGRFLSFEELLYMEGRGLFAYYDIDAQEYVAWEEAIGNYSWSPDGEQIAYDRMVYIPTGEERILVRDRQGGEERNLSSQIESGYAFLPAFSPGGDQLAFWVESGGFESQDYTLYVVDLPESEPRPLGDFAEIQGLAWSADGEQLIFSAGQFDQQQIVTVNVAEETSAAMVPGSQPAWQP